MLVRASEREEQGPFHHPHNPECEMWGSSVGDLAGLERIGVHLVRVPPGKEAAAYHTHAAEEEFYYILAGRAVVEIDGVVHEVGAGDFIGMPAPSPAHQLRNPFAQDLVYLVGGERKPVEVASLPKAGKRVIRVGNEAWAVEERHLQQFWKKEE
jgi:uncharacterized cupin superfamily protein